MKSITFNTGEFKVEKTSAWLVAFIKFAQTLGALELLEQVKVHGCLTVEKIKSS